MLSDAQIDEVRARLKARITVPHHYFVWNVTHRASTLLPPDEWMAGQQHTRWTEAGEVTLTARDVRAQTGLALCFGAHVAFDPSAELAAKAPASSAARPAPGA